MKRIIILIVLLVLLVSCAPKSTPTATPDLQATIDTGFAQTQKVEPKPTNTPQPTSTIEPTSTPETTTDMGIIEKSQFVTMIQEPFNLSPDVIECSEITWKEEKLKVFCSWNTIFIEKYIIEYEFTMVKKAAEGIIKWEMEKYITPEFQMVIIIKSTETLNQLMSITDSELFTELLNKNITTSIEWVSEAEITTNY